jgi:alkyl hydroperoxide reductase 1
MASLNISVGDTIPKGTFGTIPYTEELADHVSAVTPGPRTNKPA